MQELSYVLAIHGWLVIAGFLVSNDGPIATVFTKETPKDKSSPNVLIKRGKQLLQIPRFQISSRLVQYGDVLSWRGYYGQPLSMEIKCNPIPIEASGSNSEDWMRCYDQGKCNENTGDCGDCCIGQAASYKELDYDQRPCAVIKCNHPDHIPQNPDYVRDIIVGDVGSFGYCRCPKSSR
jgi:hypothetical protein